MAEKKKDEKKVARDAILNTISRTKVLPGAPTLNIFGKVNKALKEAAKK